MLKLSGIITVILLYISTVGAFALNVRPCIVKIDKLVKPYTALNCKKSIKEKKVDIKQKDQKESPSILSMLFDIEVTALPIEKFLFSAQRSLLNKLSASTQPVTDEQKNPVIQSRLLKR